MNSKPSALCPICHKPAVAPWLPFCSKGCGNRDLHRWLSGTYRVETEERSDSSVAPTHKSEDSD
ncbi:MAG: DNA gyrase inhibitor YacG [Alphaproteobacteria bacterium]